MSAVVVFILFVICLIIAIPVSISLGIVSVLPGAFDPSFTASASYVVHSCRTIPYCTVRWCCIPHGTTRLADMASNYRRFVHGVMGWRTCSPCSAYYSQKKKK